MDREYIIDKKNNIFIKRYPQYDNINEKVALEYKKGLILSEIINYPKPIKFQDNEIHYELLDIKQSLHEAKRNNKLKCSDLFFIGEQLRKIHDNGIIHGDFTLVNIVFTEDKIYFIDASFSFCNTDGKVVIYDDEIYKDISLFLMHLKTNNSLFQPWRFFQFNKTKKMINVFLKGYRGKKEKINYTKEIEYENKALINNIQFYKESDEFSLIARYGWIIILKFLFFCNVLKLHKYNINE